MFCLTSPPHAADPAGRADLADQPARADRSVRPHRPFRTTRRPARPLAAALALAVCWPAAGAARADDAAQSTYFEAFAPDGSIAWRQGTAGDQAPTPLPKSAPTIVPMHDDGPTANRIGLVFVGDGYTASEQTKFASAAEQEWLAFTSFEPYKTYRNFFNATRIELDSPVSGISDDPTQGIVRATPLGMHFWCHGIQRLLCVDTDAAAGYGKQVSGHNLVIAVANTSTYGGAGGEVTTVAGQNPDSAKIIIHELGHTLGGLGDEYDVPYDTATGVSSPYPNVSGMDEAGISSSKTKWYRWIGETSADGSRVGAYEGANYYKHGFWRPSADSDMRTLGVPFNPPSAEALIESFYAGHGSIPGVNPIDSVTPATSDSVQDPTATLSIVTVPLVGADYKVAWTVDGKAVPGADGSRSLKLGDAPLTPKAWNQVAVKVVDDTPMVRDEAFRTASMTQTRTWKVWGGGAPAPATATSASAAPPPPPAPAPAPLLPSVGHLLTTGDVPGFVMSSLWGLMPGSASTGAARTARVGGGRRR